MVSLTPASSSTPSPNTAPPDTVKRPAVSTLLVPQRLMREALPAHQVTHIDHPSEIADPRDVDMRREDVDAIWRRICALYRTGTHPGISFCLRRHGKIVMHRSIGHRVGNGPPGDDTEAPEPMLPDTPVCVFSASKAITAMLIHLLDDRGLLHIDDRVSTYIPEFAQRGKQDVTIRHVLTHRAGIPTIAERDRDLDLLFDWDQIVDRICASEPRSKPGRRLAYHAISGGFVLGEIVHRVTGKDIRTLLREEILSPLGFRWTNYGVDPGDLPRLARSYFTGPPVPLGLSALTKRALGVTIPEAAGLSNDPRFLTGVVPSGNVVSTAEEMSRFFQLLLEGGTLQGHRVFAPRTIHRAANESSYMELDFTLVLPVRYGLGLILGSDRVSLFGGNTPNAFGHLGFMNTIVWADPDRQISVALLTTGKPFLGPHLWPLAQVPRAIARHCRPVVAR